MERSAKLGLAATSLAVAGTLLGAAPVAADGHVVVCDKLCDPGPIIVVDPFIKIDAAFTTVVFPKVEAHAPGEVFLKISTVHANLQTLFDKHGRLSDR